MFDRLENCLGHRDAILEQWLSLARRKAAASWRTVTHPLWSPVPPWSPAPLSWPGRGESRSAPQEECQFWLAGREREKESPGQEGPVPALRAWGCSLAGTRGGSAQSLLPDQPAPSFLCNSDRALQKIKAAKIQCHCFIRKCLEIIHIYSF